MFSDYANFQGRASRSEFWWFNLFMIMVNVLLYIIYAPLDSWGGTTESLSTQDIVGYISLDTWFLATIIPVIAVWVRRLHDSDKSGWWYPLVFACGLGGIVLLVFALLPGTPGPNKYGEGPATA